MATRRILSVGALLLIVSLAPAWAGAPEALDPALAEDDECFAPASEGTSGADGSGTTAASSRCTLNALQLRREALQPQPRQMLHSAFKEVLSTASLAVGSRGPPMLLEQEEDKCQALLHSYWGCLPADGAEASLAGVKQRCSCRAKLKDMQACPSLENEVALEQKVMETVCSQCGLAVINITSTKACMKDSLDFNEAAVCGAVCQPLACSALNSCPKGFAPAFSSKGEAGQKQLKDAMTRGGCSCSAALAGTDFDVEQSRKS